MTINTQKLREALDLIEYELQASYNNAKPVCCGHGYGECCGNPEPGWDAGDQKIMDVLGPIQRMLSDAVSQADAQSAEIAEARSQIDRWKKVAESAEDRAQVAADEIDRLRDAAQMLADWAEHEVGAEPDLTPGLAEVRAALAQEGS